MDITPPYAHMHVHSLDRHGLPPAIVVALDPGIHAVVAGMQGCGVRTPSAAAVAAATIGLAGFLHIPMVGILAMGAASWIVATGLPSIRNFCWLVTISGPPTSPKGHMSCAVAVT